MLHQRPADVTSLTNSEHVTDKNRLAYFPVTKNKSVLITKIVNKPMERYVIQVVDWFIGIGVVVCTDV